MDKALGFLGICRRAGKLLIGEDGVSGAARSGEARLLMTASGSTAALMRSWRAFAPRAKTASPAQLSARCKPTSLQ